MIVFGGQTEKEIPHLGVYSIETSSILTSHVLDAPVGTLMPFCDVVVSFFESPKLLDLAIGQVLHRWPELSTGKQNSSIIRHLGPLPPIALDPANRRFAVADSEKISVVQLG